MERLKNFSFIYLLDIVIYFSCFNLVFYLLNQHHSTISTIIWWFFCMGIFLILKVITNERIKLIVSILVILLIFLTKLYSIFIIVFSIGISFYLIKIPRIVNFSNILIFQFFYFFILIYLKFTNSDSVDYQFLYLLIMLLFTFRIGLIVISSLSKSSTKKIIYSISTVGFVAAGTFALSTYIIPLLRNLFSWLVSLSITVFGFLISPIYQFISNFVQKRLLQDPKKEAFISKYITNVSPNSPQKDQLQQDVSGFQYIDVTLEKTLFILLLIVIIYVSYRLIKSLRKVKLQTPLIDDVSVNWIEQTNIPSSANPNEYTDEIDKLINQIFILANEKGMPKDDNQSIRKWSGTLPFQIPEEWIKAFESIRYNEAKNKQIHSSFIQQSQEIIQKLNQGT